ncbi:MAG TPA: hypothetical protein VLF94_04575 [Chlamydiales bacterium]|nr:hypothetical protein [Chlamydiales bacterium]
MTTAVSSRLDYLNKNPNAKTSFGELTHELDHLKVRERVSTSIAFGGTILLLIGVAGLIPGGAFVLGALAAIAAVAAAYAYFAREAENGLRNKQVQWLGEEKRDVIPPVKEPEVLEIKEPEAKGFFGLVNWFSK